VTIRFPAIRAGAAVAVLALFSSACDRTAPSVDPSNRVRVETSRGAFVIELDSAAAPLGVARFKELVAAEYFDEARFFRVMPGFMAQFGMHADPATNAAWKDRDIPDEPVKRSNLRGTISFANAGANTRSNQLFINFADNVFLDAMGFSPIGHVVEGMDVVDALYGGYGEGSNQQGRIDAEGNAFLTREFPQLDYIRSARFVRE
jgi:peptidyl-prolyl cis-trans isomerase A (cyclophilin A)